MATMKHLLLFISLSLLACHPQDDKEALMRRFTLASVQRFENRDALQKLKQNRRLSSILEKSGIINVEFYQYDSITFTILDMVPEFDYQKARAAIKTGLDQYPELKALDRILQGSDHYLLDRIFKLEQQVNYSPDEGQLIPRPQKPFQRYVMTLEIVNDPGLLKEYRRVHAIDMAWPEITANMKTVGIREMELYIYHYRAFLIMDTNPEFDWETDGEEWGKLPREKEWQTYVARFQKTNPDSKAAEKWKSMQKLD